MQHIETLENRQLLSAAVVHAAKTTKTKPTIPNIMAEFTGTGTEKKPTSAVGNLVLNVQTESAKGAITGNAANTTADKRGSITGTVNVKGVVKFKVIDSTTHKATFTFTGTYSSTTFSITGTYKGAGSKTAKPSSGIFSLMRVAN